jgi:hypothetical protein
MFIFLRLVEGLRVLRVWQSAGARLTYRYLLYSSFASVSTSIQSRRYRDLGVIAWQTLAPSKTPTWWKRVSRVPPQVQALLGGDSESRSQAVAISMDHTDRLW